MYIVCCPLLRLEGFIVPDDAEVSTVELSSTASTPAPLQLSDSEQSASKEKTAEGRTGLQLSDSERSASKEKTAEGCTGLQPQG